MKDDIKKTIEQLDKISNNYGYRKFETAVYIYMRLGNVIDYLDEEDIEELDSVMENMDGSIFNEDLNDWTFNNLEV
jgi:hypothetical protein